MGKAIKMDNNMTTKEMVDEIKRETKTMKDKVDALWTTLIGIDGNGYIKKWNNFVDNIAPRLMTKDECRQVRENSKSGSDRIGRWAERVITLALLIFVFLFGTGVI